MNAAASLAEPGHRARIYAALAGRNRWIAVLRVLVPAFGIGLLGLLLAQIVIANLANGFHASGVRLEHDRLVIDAPRYEGITQNGTSYTVAARAATALISRTDVIELSDAVLDVVRADGLTMHATASRAVYDMVHQTVEVPGQMHVVDSRKTDAVLTGSLIDWSTQILTTSGGANVVFADGTALTAQSLVFYGADDRWDMAGTRLLTPAQDKTP